MTKSPILNHTIIMILELIRSPAYLVSTIAFPSIFYCIFAVPESNDKHSANLLLVSFSCFAVFGVMFLQFGIGVAQEKSTSWYQYLKTLPISSYSLMVARFLSTLFFSTLTVLFLMIISKILTPVELSNEQWVFLFLKLQFFGIIFCFMGCCLGFWTSLKSSLPIGNLIYLPLSFAGGLWKPPEILPSMLKNISPYLPTRQYGEILWAYVRGEEATKEVYLKFSILTILFLILAILGFKRELRRVV